MDLNLAGKRAVVCGSTQGIGRAAAVELALLGADITLIARNEEKLREVCGELPSKNNQHHNYVVADFSFPDELRSRVTEYAKQNTIHILVNNTGGPPPGPAIDADIKEFVSAFSAHLLCNQILTQAFVDGMKKEKYGRIINIISTSVKVPIKGLGVSNTVRGAVANWSKTLSNELASFGITVNNVLPGATKTARFDSVLKSKAEKTGKDEQQLIQDMIYDIPAKRIASAEEVASLVAFLASPAAAYINGTSIPVDGGRTGSL
jgi:3-oxoacyl-[acyl-carrier protein] reductase